MPALIKIDYLT